MQRIAVIADIHGHLPALEAVLRDIQDVGVDLIIVNGDLADGPFPAETLGLLSGLAQKALWLRGNSDRWLVEAYDGRFQARGNSTDDLLAWAATTLSRDQRDSLDKLPLTHWIDHPPMGHLGFCHASARSDNEMILVDSTLQHAEAALAGLDAETIVLGHTHMPFDRLFDRRRMINGGSVGMPYGHAGTSWVLIDDHIVLRRTPYDVDAASARIAASGMPGALDFIRDYVRTTYSDRAALDAFRQTMQRQQAGGHFD